MRHTSFSSSGQASSQLNAGDKSPPILYCPCEVCHAFFVSSDHPQAPPTPTNLQPQSLWTDDYSFEPLEVLPPAFFWHPSFFSTYQEFYWILSVWQAFFLYLPSLHQEVPRFYTITWCRLCWRCVGPIFADDQWFCSILPVFLGIPTMTYYHLCCFALFRSYQIILSFPLPGRFLPLRHSHHTFPFISWQPFWSRPHHT